MSRRILMLSPHPDDESVGCGGTLRGHVVDGDSVRVVFLTSGDHGGHGLVPAETRRVRETEAREAASILGLEGVEFWREPDGGLRASERLATRLDELIDAFGVGQIYVTHDREAHADHRAAARLVRRVLAARPAARRPRALMCEVWTPLQKLDEIVDISPYIEVKRRAIQAHESQCRVLGFDDAFVGLARYRGELHCWPQGTYAEVFARLY